MFKFYNAHTVYISLSPIVYNLWIRFMIDKWLEIFLLLQQNNIIWHIVHWSMLTSWSMQLILFSSALITNCFSFFYLALSFLLWFPLCLSVCLCLSLSVSPSLSLLSRFICFAFAQGNGSSGYVAIYEGADKQYKITKLQPSTLYRFRLQAINSHGSR